MKNPFLTIAIFNFIVVFFSFVEAKEVGGGEMEMLFRNIALAGLVTLVLIIILLFKYKKYLNLLYWYPILIIVGILEMLVLNWSRFLQGMF